MRVLHLISSSAWGGLEIYSSELVVQLQRSAGPGEMHSAMTLPGSKVDTYLRANQVDTFRGPLRNRSKWQGAVALFKILKSFKNDIEVVHCHTRVDLWFARLALLVFNFGLSAKKRPYLVYSLYMNAPKKKDFVHRWLFSRIKWILSSSQIICDEIKRNFAIHPEKIQLLRYGRSLAGLSDEVWSESHAKAEVIRKGILQGSSKIIFGTMARLDEGKGVRELIMSLEHLTEDERRKIQIWIMGDPTILEEKNGRIEYEEQSLKILNILKMYSSDDRFSDSIKHIPFQKDYLPYLMAMDVFVLASYNETYSLSVLDAQICGKAIIGTMSGGTPEQIGFKQERGYLIAPRSAVEIAEKIRQVLQNPQELAHKAKASQQWSRHEHAWESCLKRLRSLYH